MHYCTWTTDELGGSMMVLVLAILALAGCQSAPPLPPGYSTETATLYYMLERNLAPYAAARGLNLDYRLIQQHDTGALFSVNRGNYNLEEKTYVHTIRCCKEGACTERSFDLKTTLIIYPEEIWPKHDGVRIASLIQKIQRWLDQGCPHQASPRPARTAVKPPEHELSHQSPTSDVSQP